VKSLAAVLLSLAILVAGCSSDKPEQPTWVDEEVTFRWGSLMGEKRIVRSSYGNARPSRDFPWIAREYLAGRVLLDELITRRIALADINDGFAALARGEGIRTVVEFK